MTGIVIVIILIGAVSGARALFGQRRIRPGFSPGQLRERPAAPVPQHRPLQIEWESAPEDAEAPGADPLPDTLPHDPARAATQTARADYLLGNRPPGGASDRMAALMDMMAGPGICTPRQN